MQGQLKSKKGFSNRALVSSLTACSFAVMVVTGIVLFVEPHGRIAYWTDWRFIGLGKSQWDGIHTVSSTLFITAGALHIFLNWRSLLNHLRVRLGTGIRLRKEFFVSVAVSGFFVASALWHIPPVGYLLDMSDFAKKSWTEGREHRPPFAHAEMKSLVTVAHMTGIDVEKAKAKLERQGIRVTSPDQTLRELADQNGISPDDVYQIIQRFERLYRNRNRNDGNTGRRFFRASRSQGR